MMSLIQTNGLIGWGGVSQSFDIGDRGNYYNNPFATDLDGSQLNPATTDDTATATDGTSKIVWIVIAAFILIWLNGKK